MLNLTTTTAPRLDLNLRPCVRAVTQEGPRLAVGRVAAPLRALLQLHRLLLLLVV